MPLAKVLLTSTLLYCEQDPPQTSSWKPNYKVGQEGSPYVPPPSQREQHCPEGTHLSSAPGFHLRAPFPEVSRCLKKLVDWLECHSLLRAPKVRKKEPWLQN